MFRHNCYICNTTPTSKIQETSWKKEQKDYSIEPEVCCDICVSSKWQGISTHEISTIGLPKQDLNNRNTSWHANVDGETSWMWLLRYDCWERDNLSSPGKRPLIGYLIPSIQPHKYIIQANLQIKLGMYSYIYSYILIIMKENETINVK